MARAKCKVDFLVDRQMATNSYTRRLHVSGLTPAISRDDLSARFAVFGDVKAIDDFGKLDALGQPRKFAFISLEASNDKHVKCHTSILHCLLGSHLYHRLKRPVRLYLERSKTQDW